jgi:diamine N-acetyltransferase
LAQAKVNPLLAPFGIYDGSILGREPLPIEKMVGYLMYQVMEGVGFITRLMIGEQHQKKGYGRSAMIELLRRLKMMPEIEYIRTSVAKRNAVKPYSDIENDDFHIPHASKHLLQLAETTKDTT